MKKDSEGGVVGKGFPRQRKSRKAYRSNSLTEEEQEKLYGVLDRLEDLALFRLALTTGIRREDIVKVEIGRIDFENRRLTFWESKKRRDWTVPLTREAAQALQMYVRTRPKGERYLFPFSGRTAYNRLQDALGKAGVRKAISFHDLRRSFIKTAKRRGISPKAVSQVTGDTLAVIQEHYENLDQDELKDEIDKL